MYRTTDTAASRGLRCYCTPLVLFAPGSKRCRDVYIPVICQSGIRRAWRQLQTTQQHVLYIRILLSGLRSIIPNYIKQPIAI